MTQEEVLESMVNHDPLYIVDCKNFIYYVKQVYIEGYEISSNKDEMQFIFNNKECYSSENQKSYAGFLYKDKGECERMVEKYNADPINKKRAEKFNRDKRERELFEIKIEKEKQRLIKILDNL